ncbi:MAG: F0F1 ATP synthase subunit B [Bacteroidetes bacterium]|uniref:ATP synthase subunit b n=1 Tax=Candidatus Cryptobacteroides excrementavium TaxID=2840759 RepID=A0A9D9J1V4_9BACT|nr:F0F1 ATP synthase subunit B [Candidatus Cryptobacteroides excrementavium]
MSLLLPDTGLLFWMVIIFAIVFFILAKFGFPVITKMLDKRRDYIDSSLRLAREADEKMGRMMEEQSRMIAQAREEQNRILKEAAQARDNIVRKAQEQAQDEARKILEEARVKIEAEKESALREIRSQTAMLSVKVAEKVLRQQLSTDKAQIDLVYRMLDEVTAPSKDKN